MNRMQSKTISLVLGSGGARGLAHIGIIKYLNDRGYQIKSVSGSSIGALIGGFFCAGKLDDYEKWVTSLDAFDIISLLDFNGNSGLISGKKIFKELQKIVGNANIENLNIKFTAVACDTNEEKEVWLNKGDLLKAIRASISIPIIFTPVTYGKYTLVDGGVLNPVPIAPTFGDKTDLTIAVNLGGKRSSESLLKEPSKKEQNIKNQMKDYIVNLSLKNSIFENKILSIANSSFDTMQSNISRMKLSAYPPDVEVIIPRNICGMFEFYRAKELIEYGYEVASKELNLL